jgi:hypothetical protein
MERHDKWEKERTWFMNCGAKTLYVNKHFLHRAKNLNPQRQALKVK